MTAAKKKAECVPPTTFTRNKFGLLDHVNYIFNEDGLIDWRKMVDTEHLVPNRQYTNETDVTKLRDNQLLILLGGIKELAQIRGYTSVEYDTASPSADYVVATCKISWIPNYETEQNQIIFSAIGDAGPHNTDSFAKNFLGPIAENRAFVRCVRNFLKIHIVAKDEMAPSAKTTRPTSTDPDNGGTDPKSLLQSVMKEKGISFDNIKQRLKEEKFEGSESIKEISDISNVKIFELIQRLKKLKSKF